MFVEQSRNTRYPGKGGPDALHTRIVAQSEPAKRLARAMQAQHSEFMGPRQPLRSEVGGGDPLGIVNAVQRGWRHPTVDPGHGLNPLDVVGQLARQGSQMFNPTTKSGLANVAMLFAGGPKGDATGQLNEMLPGKMFTPYDANLAAKSNAIRPHDYFRQDVGNNIRFNNNLEPFDNATAIARRTQLAKEVHDHLFGGEVHARGPIPPRPNMRSAFRRYK